jgi:crotonobetainyl-CoA:carnitine CoA-transferase CaiB-like acyl-CoA transferase
MTRILAGPMAARLLAEQGADVIHISSPNLPYLLSALLETRLGKKSAFIDLDKPNDVKQLKVLINQADIYSLKITIEAAYQNMAYLHWS